MTEGGKLPLSNDCHGTLDESRQDHENLPALNACLAAVGVRQAVE